MNEDPREFRRRRIEAGLSQTELARRIGKGRSRICDVEKERAGLAPEDLKKVAEIFGCEVHDLLLPDSDDTTGVIQSVRAAIGYPCPACDAEPKKACLTPAGRQLPGVHRARTRLAQRDARRPHRSVA
ncbi:helix-turn-helix transcriptional regulator [Streptomyces sp. NBC_00996]|uniref:helix-turn-helix transcriptional regulator n=1 Tax=Streptomyces sp. NBC_00996 TaxID=2903710 RepID=UPI003863F833|nr:helix-turn-helix domain-containing protein [Streptomyces sp. NBC_00996]